jgi:hypothetical protein
MSELTLDALGFRADEARTARRIHDLTTPHAQRAKALRIILGGCAQQQSRVCANGNGTPPTINTTRNLEA